jgi:hypothetical protein
MNQEVTLLCAVRLKLTSLPMDVTKFFNTPHHYSSSAAGKLT